MTVPPDDKRPDEYPPAIGHYEFIRFHLKEPPKDALWMAIFAEAEGLPMPTPEEQRFIKERWND